MNLLCVTHGPMYAAPTNGHWAIAFGEVYHPIGEQDIAPFGKYYTLAEDPNYGYAEEHFVVLPDDEEIEAAEMDAELAEVVAELQTA